MRRLRSGARKVRISPLFVGVGQWGAVFLTFHGLTHKRQITRKHGNTGYDTAYNNNNTRTCGVIEANKLGKSH